MDDTVEDNEPVSSQWNPVVVTVLLLLLAPVALAVLPAMVMAALFVHSYFVADQSASTRIADLQTDLTLRFYSIWDENNDSGRYLYVHAPSGRIRVYMRAYDWAHNSRTSV